MNEIPKANTITDAWRACDLTPLEGDKLRWWVDLSKARASSAKKSRLETYLELRPEDQWMHIAFTGHRGCGKSTELLRLKSRWEQNYFVVYFEMTDLLDPNDVAFSDLFLATSMVVAQACHDAGMPLDAKLLKNVQDFAVSVIEEKTMLTSADIASGAEAELGAKIPFFATLKARITSQFKASTENKVTIRRAFERDVTRLLTDTNLLLDDARSRVRKRKGNDRADLLIIIDNLDRVPPDVGERLVFQHGDLLKQLRANIIYTVPVSVLHSQKGIERAFPRHDILPMLTVYKHAPRKLYLDWDEAGVRELVRTVKQRVDVSAVFDSAELVAELARYSGGCLRHLMQLVQSACEATHTRDGKKVNAADVRNAVARMQFDFERMIPPEHYPFLREVARTKNAANHDIGRAALYNLSVLEYNGERRWNYVHPVVRNIEQFREQVDAKKESGARKPRTKSHRSK